MAQSNEEIVKARYAAASIKVSPGGSHSADALFIGSPAAVAGHFSELSKLFPLGTAPEVLWASAYDRLIENAHLLLYCDAQRKDFHD